MRTGGWPLMTPSINPVTVVEFAVPIFENLGGKFEGLVAAEVGVEVLQDGASHAVASVGEVELDLGIAFGCRARESHGPQLAAQAEGGFFDVPVAKAVVAAAGTEGGEFGAGFGSSSINAKSFFRWELPGFFFKRRSASWRLPIK